MTSDKYTWRRTTADHLLEKDLRALERADSMGAVRMADFPGVTGKLASIGLLTRAGDEYELTDLGEYVLDLADMVRELAEQDDEDSNHEED